MPLRAQPDTRISFCYQRILRVGQYIPALERMKFNLFAVLVDLCPTSVSAPDEFKDGDNPVHVKEIDALSFKSCSARFGSDSHLGDEAECFEWGNGHRYQRQRAR